MKWKKVPGFKGYVVNEMGVIKAVAKLTWNHNKAGLCLRKERILKGKPDRNGYISHCLQHDYLKKRNWLSHRIVAFAWLDNPENLKFINHKNGVKTDNRVKNLEWCTSSQNQKHAYSISLSKPSRGEANGNHKLTPDQVLLIRSDKRRSIDVAKDYGIGRTTVDYIKRGILWAHLK